MNVSKETFACPSLQPTINRADRAQSSQASNGDVTYTGFGYAYSTAGSGRFAGGYEHPGVVTDSHAMKATSVKYPAKMYAFMDTWITTPTEGYCGIYRVYHAASYLVNNKSAGSVGGGIGIPHGRHNKSLNIVFVDGHVGSMEIKHPENPYLDIGSGYGAVMWTGARLNDNGGI